MLPTSFPAASALLGFAALALVSGPACAAGKEGARDTLELPPARADQPFEAGSGRTVVIPSDEDRLMGSLGDALERQAGVHVMRAGGIGDYLGVSLRGSSERQVDVYIDGVLQNPAAGSALFLGDMSLAHVERIEIHKGLAPDALPGTAIGGSIHIVTRKGAGRSDARAALGAGSFGTFRTDAGVSYRGRAWTGHANASRDQSRGDFPYYDDDGAEFMPGRHPQGAPRLGEEDLVKKVRRNNAHGFTALDVQASRRLGRDGEAGAQAGFSRLHKEVPAPYANLDTSVILSAFRESERFSGRAFSRWSAPGLELSADLSASLIRDLYVDTAGGRGAVGVGYDQDGNDYADLLGFLRARRKLTESVSLSALASYGLSGYLYTDHAAGEKYPWLLRHTGEGKVSPSLVLGRHAWQADLSGAVSLQGYGGAPGYAFGGARVPREDRRRHWSLQGAYRYRPRDWFWLSAETGSAFRMPTFLEQFGDRGTLLANPALLPESGLHASLGLHAQSSWSSAEVRGFAREGRRIITLVQNSQSVLLYSNTGDTRVQGVEARFAAGPRTWTRTTVDLTFQKAVNLSGGARVDDYKLIPYRPMATAALRQAFPYRGWTLTVDGHYQGLAYPNPSNRPSLFDSYSHNTDWQSRWDVSLSYRSRHLLAMAGIQNAFDQRNFDFFNFPLPGRRLSAAVQVGL